MCLAALRLQVESFVASSRIARWGAIGLVQASVIWVVLGLSSVVGYLQAIPGREDVVLFIVAMLLTAASLVGLHTLQKDSYGRLGRTGFYVALAAIAAHVLGAVLYLAGDSAFQWLSSPVGAFGMLTGFVLYGIATLRARVAMVWLDSRRFHARFAGVGTPLGGVLEQLVVRSVLPGDGLRALVVEKHSGPGSITS